MPEIRRGTRGTRGTRKRTPSPAEGREGGTPRPHIFDSAAKGAEVFIGRDWVLDQIVDWMDHGSERFFLLIGEPGWGKSSLAAWMIGPGRAPPTARGKSRRKRLRDAFSAAYLCSATSGSTVNPTTFTRSIAAQLAHRFDDFASAFLQRAAPGQFNINITADEIIGRAIGVLTQQINVQAADAREVYELSVRLPLADIAATDPNGDPIFILVDGLDEALTFKSPNIVDLLAASTDFPDRIRFVLTSRRVDSVLVTFHAAGARMIDASDIDSQARNDGDIRDYVRERASDPLVAAWIAGTGKTTDAFVTDLVAQAAGNFLFIRFVLDNPPKSGDAVRTVPAVPAVPTGLEAAYDQFLARVMPDIDAYGFDPTWTESVRPVLGALTVAIPAAPESAIPHWLGSDRDVNTAIATVGQMTEWVNDDGGSRRLYHRSLGDFLSMERLPAVAGAPLANRFFVQPRQQHQAIVDYYLQAIDDEWDGDWKNADLYGLRRVVPHLYALREMTEGRTERAEISVRLCDLALDPGFQKAQRDKLGDGSATIEAIRLALLVCTETGDPEAIRERAHSVAASWEPELRASAARAIAELNKTNPKAALDELKALLR